MVLLGNFRSVSQVIPWKEQHYCWDHFRDPKRIPKQRLNEKNERRDASKLALVSIEVEGRCRYDFSVTSQRESFSSSSRVRFTLNSAPASRRSAWPFARSNSNRTGRRPGELARILRTSRNSSPVVAGENCKSTADSLSVDPSVAPLGFRGESVLISCATPRGISSRLSSVPFISTTRPASRAPET